MGCKIVLQPFSIEAESCLEKIFRNCNEHHKLKPRRKGWKFGTTSSFFFFTLYCVLTSCLALNPPDISPPGETLTVERGQSLQLYCHGDEPLVWSHAQTDLKTDGRVNISTYEDSTSSRNYSSSLKIDNIGHLDAGFITCHYHGTPSDSTEILEDIRVIYVIDEDYLLQKPSNTIIYGALDESVIIPCKPLWQDVKIELIHDNDHDITLTDENYSPKVGYTIFKLKPSNAGFYACKGSFGNTPPKTELFMVQTVEPRSKPGLVSFPLIQVEPRSSVRVGETLEILCYTQQLSNVYYRLELTGPVAMDDSRVTRSNGTADMYFPGKSGKSWFSKLAVAGVKKEDSGKYSCTVVVIPDNNGIKKTKEIEIKVYGEGEMSLEVSAQKENITVKENQTAVWIINISSFPPTHDVSWRNPLKKIIHAYEKSTKYSFENTTRNDEYRFRVFNASLEDIGNYQFIVQMPGNFSKTLNLSLNVNVAPRVMISMGNYSSSSSYNCKANTICELSCIAKGNPKPRVRWTFEDCDTPSSCKNKEVVNESEITRKDINHHETELIVKVHAVRHRKYSCEARTECGSKKLFSGCFSNSTTYVIAADFQGNDLLNVKTDSEEIVEGDNVNVTCAVTNFNGEVGLSWKKMEAVNGIDKLNNLSSNFVVKSITTELSYQTNMSITNISKNDAGFYLCLANRSDSQSFSNYVKLKVISPSKPTIVNTNLNNSGAVLKLGSSLNLTCEVEGKPTPEITWTWADHETNWPKDLQYEMSRSSLLLTYVPVDAQGRYKCVAKNRIGTAENYIDISVTGTKVFSNLAVCIILVLFIVVIISGAFLARYKYKQNELQEFLDAISKKEFYEGDVENINPELSVADQAYLLPFDSRLEFPRDRLKLKMQLGSGAFGRVVKAEACGILESETVTTVAVKMVKPNADKSHFKALMSELKIMIHLGKHMNVVNLLGACTKNLAKKKELFVIVEYCKYGSLLSYVHRHKRTFINQLDPARGIIDSSIDCETNRNSEQSQARTIHYAQLTFTDPGNSRKPASNGYRTLDEFKEPNGEGPPTPTLRPIDQTHGFKYNDMMAPQNRRSTEHYVPESQVESVCTGMSYLSNGPSVMTTDGTTKRNSSCGQWQDHYRGDYQARDVKPIKTTDLLCWAFQIARGMDYLASRKVLHGDLAARNVLLAENNIVKICDFGLAKEMYKDYKYKKKSEGVLLPVKWMAIESIYYGLFSTQSDCWSFGVVLWELFTLGKTPYPGMDADERFYKRIMEGYRMEKPPFAPSCVYDIMLECWAQEPTDRPSFSALVDRIGDMMEDGLREHYVGLNSPYMKINQTYMADRPDYLLRMGRSELTPDRQYQNVSEEVDNSGYLVPIPPPLSPTADVQTQSPSTSGTAYQNVPKLSNEPSCSMVAVNSGYHLCSFTKNPTETTDDTDNPHEESSFVNNVKPKCTVQIRFSPDIKDMYGLREDSASPDLNSLSDINVVNELDENQEEIIVRNEGIKGIDNMNYVPFPFTELPTSNTNSTQEGNNHLESNKSNGFSHINCKQQKRQKNDSGLGSIDSTQFEQNQKCSSPENQQQLVNDLKNLQRPNGYVSHKHISSFS